MALIDDIDKANALFTLLERVDNMAGQGTITSGMYLSACKKINEALETIFPPLPPPE